MESRTEGQSEDPSHGLLRGSQLHLATSGQQNNDASHLDFRRENVRALLSMPVKSLRMSFSLAGSTGEGAAYRIPGGNEHIWTMRFANRELEIAYAMFALSDRTSSFVVSLVVSVFLTGFAVITNLEFSLTWLFQGLTTCGTVMFIISTVILYFYWRSEDADRTTVNQMIEDLSSKEDGGPLVEDCDPLHFAENGERIARLEWTISCLLIGLYTMFAAFTLGKGPESCSDVIDRSVCSRHILIDGGIVSLFILPLAVYPVRFFVCALVTAGVTIVYIAVRELPSIRNDTTQAFRLVSIMWYIVFACIAILAKRLSERESRAHFRELCMLEREKERSRRLEEYYSSIAAAMIPESVARRIARGELYRERLDHAVICSVGVRGFSKLSSEWSSSEVVLMLQHVTVQLDGLLRSLGTAALKVHSFGDEYLVVLHEHAQALHRDHHRRSPSQSHRTSRRSSEQPLRTPGASDQSEVDVRMGASRSCQSAVSLSTACSDRSVEDTLLLFVQSVSRMSRDLEPACRGLSSLPVCLDVAVESGALFLTSFGAQKNFLAVGPSVDRCRNVRRLLEHTPTLRKSMVADLSSLVHTIVATCDSLWTSFIRKGSRITPSPALTEEGGRHTPVFLDWDSNEMEWASMLKPTVLLVPCDMILSIDPKEQDLMMTTTAATTQATHAAFLDVPASSVGGNKSSLGPTPDAVRNPLRSPVGTAQHDAAMEQITLPEMSSQHAIVPSPDVFPPDSANHELSRVSFLPLYKFHSEDLERQFKELSSQNSPAHFLLILLSCGVVFAASIVSLFLHEGPPTSVMHASAFAAALCGALLSGLALVVCGVLLITTTKISKGLPSLAFFAAELILSLLFIATIILARDNDSVLSKGHCMWYGVIILMSMLREHAVSVPYLWALDAVTGGTFVWLAYVSHNENIRSAIVALIVLFMFLVFICRGLLDRAQRYRFVTSVESRRVQEHLLKDGEALEELLRHMVPNEMFAQLFRRTRIAATPLTAMVLTLRAVLPRGTLYSTKVEAMSILQMSFAPRSSEPSGSRDWWLACDAGLSLTDRALRIVRESCVIKTSGDVVMIVDDSSHDATTQAMVLLQLVTYMVHTCRSEHPQIVLRGALTNGPTTGAVLGIAALSFEYHGEAVTVGASVLREMPRGCDVIASTRFVELLQWNSLFGEASSSGLPTLVAAQMDDIHKGFDLTAQFDEPPSTGVSKVGSSADDVEGHPMRSSSATCVKAKLVHIMVHGVMKWRVRGIKAMIPVHHITIDD